MVPSLVNVVFDDGPCKNTLRILDILAHTDTKATFALVGRNALEFPHIVKRIAAEGHTVANHTMTHARLTDLTDTQVTDEIALCHIVLSGLVEPPFLLRPPFASCDERVKRLAGHIGYDVLEGSSIGDYLYENPDELTHAAKGFRGFIGLHDWHEPTVQALPGILAA